MRYTHVLFGLMLLIYHCFNSWLWILIWRSINSGLVDVFACFQCLHVSTRVIAHFVMQSDMQNKIIAEYMVHNDDCSVGVYLNLITLIHEYNLELPFILK